MCDMTRSRIPHYLHSIRFIEESLETTHSYVRYGAFSYSTHNMFYTGVVLCIGLGFIGEMFPMTHLCVQYGAFTYLTLLTHNTIYTGVVGHESFLCGIWGISDCFVWYIGLWFVEELLDVTHSNVRYDAFSHTTLLTLNMSFRGVVGNDSFLCTIWRVFV